MIKISERIVFHKLKLICDQNVKSDSTLQASLQNKERLLGQIIQEREQVIMVIMMIMTIMIGSSDNHRIRTAEGEKNYS